MKRIALAAGLLLAAAAFAGVGRPDGARALDGTTAPTSTDTVTVAGSGSVDVTPTTAVFSFGVDSKAPTAKAALAANAREMRAVIGALMNAGAKNITTQSVSVSQAFGQNGAPDGFQAANTVTATASLANAGATIDAAVEAGANRVDGPSVSSEDQAVAYRKALAAAMDDARLRAETLARAAGRALGAVTTVVEASDSAPIPMADKMAASSAGTPVEAGVQEITAGVTVTYELS